MADVTESIAVYTPTGRVVTQQLHKDLGGGITGPQVVSVNPDNTPILGALTPLLLSALTVAAAVKESAAGRLNAVAIFNPNSSDAYVQVFDIALHTSVALGTTVPKLSFWVPALGGYSDSWPAGMAFAAGLSLAATTTPTGAATAVTGLVVNVLYQ